MSGRAARARGLALATLAWLAAAPVAAEEIVVATTTSVHDSGLFGELLPLFEAETGIHVRLVAVGSGAALRMGAQGDADALVTHAPPAEEELVASGVALERRPFMENHFVIAGPGDDPADVAKARDGADALRRIARAGARYVSRADDSGTHRRERALMRAAGLDPEAEWPDLARTGEGMGITLMVAGERRAYTLSDVGTYLAFRERVDLAAFAPDTPDLRNVYSVLRLDPERLPGRIRAETATRFADFLVSRAAQERIDAFGRERFGRPLFRPLRLAPASDS